MLVAKPLPHGGIEDTDRSADEAPAAFADVRSRAAGSDAVVVRHVDIKNELSLSRSKSAGSYGLPIARSSGVDRPDLESGRVQGARLFFKLVCCRKRVVSQIDVVLEGERDLAVGEEPTRGVLVVQPFEYGLEGVETAIEDEHELRSWCLCLSGRHLGFVYTSSSRGCGAS